MDSKEIFSVDRFFPQELFFEITDIKTQEPRFAAKIGMRRKRRKQITTNGKLVILAADHPARGVLQAGANPLIMGNRYDFLGRIIRILINSRVDGVMSTVDVIEELFAVEYLLKERGHDGFLDNKVLIGCMNRGGLKDSVFELDDRMTGLSIEGIRRLGLDGGKVMIRISLDDVASLDTLMAVKDAINDLSRHNIPIFIEPLPVKKNPDGKIINLKTAADYIKIINIVMGLGDSYGIKWLKIPYTPEFEKVVLSTTAPILMLGGGVRNETKEILEEFYAGMHTAPNVRGVLVGRNIMYPAQGEDPYAMASAIGVIVHQNASVDEAIKILGTDKGIKIDYFDFMRKKGAQI
ncbi:MAG: deoxyribose-phosphate aldolase [Candidatus Korarchaeota archaeon]